MERDKTLEREILQSIENGSTDSRSIIKDKNEESKLMLHLKYLSDEGYINEMHHTVENGKIDWFYRLSLTSFGNNYLEELKLNTDT
jgi:hypothetical protein